MELEYRTEEEIIDFFQNHTGGHKVIRIAELLISHNNPQDVEIFHIRKLLHKLKAGGFLIVKNEGGDIYHEEFSSTPDRIEKYFESTSRKKNYYDNKNTNSEGEVCFDYSSNDHTYFIGEGEELFGIRFSGASQRSIYVYKAHSSIRSLALVKGFDDIDGVNLNRKYDGTSRTRCPEIGQIVLLRNINNKYALIQILDIKMESRGDESDEVKFKYKILKESPNDIIAEPENNFEPGLKKLNTNTNLHNTGIIAGGSITAGGDILVGSQKSEKIERDASVYWYQKPLGILMITIVAGVVIAGITYFLGWN